MSVSISILHTQLTLYVYNIILYALMYLQTVRKVPLKIKIYCSEKVSDTVFYRQVKCKVPFYVEGPRTRF